QGGNDIYLAEDHTLEMQELEKQLAESAELMDQMQEDYLEKRKAELELMNDPAAMAKEVNAANLPVTGIGDSVMLGAVSNLYATFPHGDFDAKQNRSYYPLYSIVQTRSGNGTLGNPVVIGIGTNSVMPLDTMRQIIRMCGNRYVYWLTITNNWQFANNDNIKKVASEFDNVVVIDWETYSKGHSDYFYSDGIHLTPTGRQAYANYILECISRDLMTRKMEQDKQKLMMGVGDGYLLTSLDYIRATEGMEDLFVVCEEKVGIDKLLDTINEMKENDVMAAKVFIALGNKETFSVEQLSSVFEALSDCKVMLVKVPGLKDNMTNTNIDIAVEGYENISIVDLSNLYREHPEYFTPDRVHFNEEGSRFFADLILQEIENQWK
ncbi:MAG: hypothetical protein IJI05_04405, partial [Erysipelotrichaceae bacterium]|nr:hypothetical protein [Erysipelotrichaceae bacterium]